jgi:hypothetical protein
MVILGSITTMKCIWEYVKDQKLQVKDDIFEWKH